MTDPKDLLARRMAALKAEYERQLPDRIVELRAAYADADAATDDETCAAALVELRRIAHRLVGSGKTFGLPWVSETAAPIERVVDAIMDGQRRFAEAGLGDLIESLAEFDTTSTRSSYSPINNPVLRPVPRSARPEPPAEVGLLWLAGIDEGLAGELSTELARYGFRTERLVEAEIGSAISRKRPMALIAGLQAMARTSTGRWTDPFTPLIAVGDEGDTESRLAAVRMGASGFVVRPPDVDQLVTLLDRLLERTDPEPYRVILVEDDEILASSFVASLEAEDMQVTLLADPMNILEVCRTFAPDIVVTDLYLPKADGIEMAQVIHQHGGFTDIPILFVSSETNLNRQLAARRLGADDFLTKPLTSDQLVTAVMARALRYRELRRLMDRDSLTGLLNHARTSARLDREIERCRDAGEPLSAVAIDIDHFKRVNDTYGHATGDKVLRTISRLLLQRLRGSDTAGRFGGEEFVVVLPGADAQAAFNVIDGLMRAFSEIEHVSGEHRFHVTFSAGLATLKADDHRESLLARADTALYEAKEAGRNRIGVD